MDIFDVVAFASKAMAIMGFAVALMLIRRAHAPTLWGLQALLGLLLGLTVSLLAFDIAYGYWQFDLEFYSDMRRAFTGLLLAGSAWSFVWYLVWGQ